MNRILNLPYDTLSKHLKELFDLKKKSCFTQAYSANLPTKATLHGM